MTTPTPLPHAVAIQMCSDFDEASQTCGDPNHSPVSCTCLKLAMTWRTMQRDLAAAQEALATKDTELASVKGHAEALENIESSLRRAGATLPAPEPTGTIEGAMNTGLCIALCVVVDERRRAMGAAVSGGGEIIGVASASATNSCATTHSQECPPHEQKQPQPANPKDAP